MKSRSNFSAANFSLNQPHIYGHTRLQCRNKQSSGEYKDSDYTPSSTATKVLNWRKKEQIKTTVSSNLENQKQG